MGEMTESRGSVEAVRTAITTGKVEVTSETCKIGQVETQSRELGIIKETQELKEVKETQKLRGERNSQNKRGADK